MIFKAKIKDVSEWVKVERIDFYQSTFSIFYKDSGTTEAMAHDFNIERIVDGTGRTIFAGIEEQKKPPFSSPL